MWYWSGYGPSFFEWLVMAISMALIWAALAWGMLTLLRSPRFRASPASPDRSTPEEILARRFAAGEIDEAEFDHRMAVLHGHFEHASGAR